MSNLLEGPTDERCNKLLVYDQYLLDGKSYAVLILFVVCMLWPQQHSDKKEYFHNTSNLYIQ